MERHVSELLNKYKNKKILKRAMALVCAFVLLFTMNSLKRTADTLSRKPMCGIKKHQHSAKCYDANGELTCGKVEHVHTDACYQMRPVEGDLLVTEDADETVAEADQNLTLAEEQSAENQQTSVESNTEQTLVDVVPEYRLGEKARLSKIIEKTGLGIKLKKVIEVGVVDTDGTQADLIKVTPRGSDYVIKAQKDFKSVELALVLKDEVRTVKLVQGKAPAQEEAPAASANSQPVSNAAPKAEQEADLTVEEAKTEEQENKEENTATEEQENKEENTDTEEAKGEQTGDETGEQTEGKTEEEAGEKSGEENEEKSGDKSDEEDDEKSGEEEQAAAINNVGTEQGEESGEETASEQIEGKTEEKSEEEAGEQTGDEAGEKSEEESGEKSEEESGDEAGEKSDEENEEEAGYESGEKSEEEAGEQTGDENEEKSDEEAGEQTGDENEEKSDEEAGDQTGDEADNESGEKSDEESGEQTGDEAGEQTGDENEEESGEQTGDEAGDESGEKSDEENEDESGDEAGDESGEKSEEEAGEQTGDEAGEESGEKSDEENEDESGDESGEKSDEENEEEAGDESGEEAGEENEEEDGEENEEEGEEPEFTEGVREIPVNDCVVTLSWSAEAHIPADVEIVIHEIKKGTEDYDFLYNQALAELPEPEQAVTQVMHFFDITLYSAEGEKIEPEAPVSVQVKVNESIDGEVNALHCEEVGAPMQTVDANAEGKSVAFDAPSFSVYGVNYTKPAQQESISAEVSVDLSSVDLMSAATVGADGVTLSVSDLLEAKDDGVQSDVNAKLDAEAFVKDAEVTSSDVQVQDGKITLSTDALEKGTVSLQVQKEEVNDYVTTVTTQTVEIKLADYAGRTEGIDESNISVTALGDNSLPADAKATVEEKTSVPEEVELEEGESAAAFDITIKNQKGDVISETGSVAVTVKPSDLNVLSELPEGAVATDIRYQLVHIHDDGSSETIDLPKDAVVVDETGKVESFSFETESFSTYIFKYTVDFEYIDEEGEAHTWYFPGTGSYRIAEVLAALGIEAEEITSAELELVKAVGETSEAALYVTQDEDGEWWINSDEAFDDTYELTVVADGKTYVITVTDEQIPNSNVKYHVSLAFQENNGTPSTPSEDKYYLYAAVKMPTDTSSAAIYYYTQKFDISKPNDEIEISWFKRDNHPKLDNIEKTYYSYDEVLAANKSVTIKLVKSDGESFVQTNPDETVVDRIIRTGEIKSGTVIEEGDVTDGYAITMTKGTNSTSIVAKKPNAFYYTVAVDNIDRTNDLNLNDQIWYVYATVGRSDGTYVYAKQLTRAMIGQSVQLDVFHYTEKPDEDNWTTVAKTGENVQFSLVRAKNDPGDNYLYTLTDSTEGNEWKYFSDSARINSTAANGGSVANRYTLNVVGNALTLKETRNHTITLAPYTVAGTPDSSVDLARTDGKYYVVGRMAFRDGIVNKTRYYASEVGSGLEYTISEGFKDENGNDAFLLTGARSYETGLAFVPNTISDANAFNKIATQDGNVEFFWNGDSVESYRITAGKGTVEEPNTTVTLRKLPQITVNAEVHGTDDNAAALVGNDHYTLLARLEKDGVVGYAYVPLSFDGAGHMTATSFNSFDVVDSPRRTIYKAEEDEVQYYVVKTGSAVASLSEALAGTRYMAGQLMGDYTPEITAASDSVNVVLARTEVHPIAYNVDIRILNKELNAYASDINLGNDYYFVLASLVPKDGNQVVAWKVIPVNKTDLTADGQWRYQLQTNDFKVCDFAGNAIGTEVTGYDPNLYDLKLRLYHSANFYDTYNDLRDEKKASDLAPSGYDIVGVYTKDNEYQGIKNDALKITEENTSAIRLHAAYTKQYKIKVYVDKPGLVIPAGDNYLVWTKLEHANSSGTTNALAKLSLNGETEKVLDFYPNSNGGIWFDGNTGAETYTFTGNEHEASVTIVKPNTSGWSLNQPGHFSWLNEGSSLNFYSWHAGERETEESVDPDTNQPVTIVYDVIRFTKDNGISKGVIDDFLSDATNFGLYTLDFAEDTADMEANVAAHELTAGGMVDYGFSTNNIFINRLRVMKKYMEDGSPVSRQVKLRLYKDGELQEEVTRTTGADGILYFTFENLAAGTYEVREFVDNQEVSYGETGITTTAGGTTVTIMDPNIVIDAINTNINYFGSIRHDIHGVVLAKSRHGLILVDSEEDYNKLLAANGGEHEGIASVYMAGTENKPSYNIPEDMQRLRNLSKLLATSASSQTVRIVNVDLDTFNTENWRQSLADDGRYIVLNIDVTGKDVVSLNSTIWLNNHQLHAQFGKAGSEDASHVLYNIVTRDKNGNLVPFNGTLTSAREGAGVLLAPSAVVYGANGNWGGTIIAKEYHHVSGEIHSENTNKIVTKNTSLINEKGTTTQTGSLKLAKVVKGLNDRTTYFTFRLTLKNSEGAALSDQEFTITGLSGEEHTIHLDENGQVDIPVRAMGDVIILGLPVGTQYEVEEVVTPETEHFHLIQVVDADGNVVEPEAVTGRIAATGDIAAQEIDVVTVQNAHKVGGLTVMKTVVGDINGNKKFHFKVTLKPNGEVKSEDIQNKYFGSMHFTPEGENSVYEFNLGNGESLTAKEIPTGTRFTVEETPVAGFVPSVNLIADVPEGEVEPQVNGATVTGEIIEDGEGNKIAIIAAYKNAHYEGASYVPKVTKELVINGTTTPVSGDLWPEGGFEFTITPAPDNPNGVSPVVNFAKKTATATDKTVSFDLLTFTSSESDEWPPDPDTGTRNRTFTYTITETVPNDAVSVSDNATTYEQASSKTGYFKKDGIFYSADPITLIIVVGPREDEGSETLLEIKSVQYSTDSEAATTAEDIDDAAGAVINMVDDTTNISVEKRFDPTLDGSVSWEASFKLQSAEKLISSDGVAAQGDWSDFADVEGRTFTLYVNKEGESENKLSDSVAGLPKYISRTEGGHTNVYELKYTVVETALTIDGEDDKLEEYVSEVTVTENNGTFQIVVVNSVDTSKTHISVEKVWSDGNDKHSSDTVTVQLYKAYGAQVTPDPVTLTVQATGTPNDGVSSLTVMVDGTQHVLNQSNGWTWTKSVMPGSAHTVTLADNPYAGEVKSAGTITSETDAGGNISYSVPVTVKEYANVTIAAQGADSWTLPTDGTSAINFTVGSYSYALNNANNWSVTVPASEKKFEKGITPPTVTVTGVAGSIAANPTVGSASVDQSTGDIIYTITAEEYVAPASNENTVSVKINWMFDSSMSSATNFKVWTQQFPYNNGIVWAVDGNQWWKESQTAGTYTYSYTGVTSDGVQKDYALQYGVSYLSDGQDASSDFTITMTTDITEKEYDKYPIIRGNATATQEITLYISYNNAGQGDGGTNGGDTPNGTGTIVIVNPNHAVNVGWCNPVKQNDQAVMTFDVQKLNDEAANHTVTITDVPAGVYTIQGENFDWATFSSTNCWHNQYCQNDLYVDLKAGATETITLHARPSALAPSSYQLASASPLDFLFPMAYADDNSVPQPDAGYLPAGAVPIANTEMLLGANNNWTYTWTNLPKIEVNPNTGKECFVYYYVVETASTNSKIETTAYAKTYQADDATTTDENESERIDQVTITNTVHVDKVGRTHLYGTKTLNGRDFKSGDKWTFTVTASPGTPMPANSSVDLEPTSGNTATIDFGEINFTEAHIGQTFTYTVTESLTVDGVTNDSSKQVTVTVADGTSALVVTNNADSVSTTPLAFVNTYDADGSATFSGTKSIANRDFKSGDTFTIQVVGSENAPMPTGATGNTYTKEFTATAGQNAFNYTLDDIGYQLSDIPQGEASKTFTYTVTESAASMDGTVKDSTSYTVTVTISDNGDGHLNVVKSDNYNALNFTNTYSATGTGNLTGTKTLLNKSLANGQFQFSAIADSNNPASGLVTTSWNPAPSNDASGNINFGSLTFNATGIWKFIVKETSTGGSGITVDHSEYEVTYDVTDVNKDGILTVDRTIRKIKNKAGETVNETGSNITVSFENDYSASTDITFKVRKIFVGRSNSLFTFKLTEVDDQKNPLTGAEPDTVQVTRNGEASFDPIHYTLSDAGTTHYYIIEEDTAKYDLDSDGNGLLGGVLIHFDTAKQFITVNVVDNGDGTMTATPTYEIAKVGDADATFTNTEKTTKTGIKGWDNLPENDTTAKSATLRLTRYKGTALDTSFNTTGYMEGVLDGTVDGTITGELTAWNYTWGNLEKVYLDSEANGGDGGYADYIYKVEETQFVYGDTTYTTIPGENGVYTVKVGNTDSTAWITKQTLDTVINTKNDTWIKVKKVWLENGIAVTTPTDGTKTIEVKLYRFNADGKEQTEIATYNLTTDSSKQNETGTIYAATYSWRIDGLDKYYLDGDDLKQYRYSIVETQPSGWTIAYYTDGVTKDEEDSSKLKEFTSGVDAKVTEDGEITVTNSKWSVSLPATGGSGTTLFYAVGSALLLLALLGIALTLRRKARNGIE